MTFTAEIGSGATIYIHSFVKIVQAFKCWCGADSQTQTQLGYLRSLILFLQNKKSLLKIYIMHILSHKTSNMFFSLNTDRAIENY
jgi:hypothetical protein